MALPQVPDKEKLIQILTRYWGHTSFRPLQEEIITSVMQGRDTLALMPTGGGKSVTFQVPALAMEGICIVVTPLVALMRDQVIRLLSMDIKAQAIHSGMTREEIDIALDNCAYGDYKFLYISPERISSPLFQSRIGKLNVNLIAVDEAHCISQWGYDFRPSYIRIAEMREMVHERVPVLALTATATERVVSDIMDKLKFRDRNVLRTSFVRPNISYVVRKVEDKGSYLTETLRKIRGSGIVYVRSRKKTKEIAEMLVRKGIPADFYHAGLTTELREKKQSSWTSGDTRIIVATNAFGMGIDKPDVRFVIHWDIPDCIESYFQESGRAGRDEKPAWAVLIWNQEDKNRLLDTVRHKFPPLEKIKDIYDALGNFLDIPVGGGKNNVYDFDLEGFVMKYRLPVSETYNSLGFLQRESYIEFTEEINNPSRIHFLVGRDDLYKFQVANESFDSFIKLLLRSYTGMFSDYVPVNEEFLSKKTGVSRDTIYQYLVRLSSHHIISYIPGKKTPLVIYTEERLDRRSLVISPDNYRIVKEKYIFRLDRMLEYVENETRCRSVMLLAYFGEESDRCGKCDTCKSSNELEISKYEFDIILEEIKVNLEKGDHDVLSLTKAIDYQQDKVVRVIRWLLDHNKLENDVMNKLRWKSQ
ncbi:MAG: ATP-dependent DNA helicase RecQ [Bacteroidales bacterium]|jgi:ATP-dependent DNA helicase RecQ|nr:ATP-dependent DNA helicase RecQ [Bacteroidales bacterium]